jgi:hypothetical protein
MPLAFPLALHVYVPPPLVPRLKRALKNGRQMEILLYQAGPALIREHRQNQASKTTLKVRVTLTKPTTSVKMRESKTSGIG